jgi:hypothetical protein
MIIDHRSRRLLSRARFIGRAVKQISSFYRMDRLRHDKLLLALIRCEEQFSG